MLVKSDEVSQQDRCKHLTVDDTSAVVVVPILYRFLLDINQYYKLSPAHNLRVRLIETNSPTSLVYIYIWNYFFPE